MASRVNTKFVIALSAGLLAIVAIVAFFAIQAQGRSTEDAIRQGDEAMAAGDATKAAGFYSRAVNKDQRNPEFIKKWISALEKRTPTPRQVYEDTFANQYLLAVRSMCDADRKNPEVFRKYLGLKYEIIQKTNRGLQPWERFAVEYEDLVKKYAGDEKGKDALRRYRGFARFGILSANKDASAEIVDGGLADLEAAIAVDPNDGESLIKAASIEAVKAERARNRGDNVAAEQLERSSRQRLEAFAKTDNALAPLASVEMLRKQLTEQARNAKDPAAVMEVLRSNKDAVAAIIAKVKSAPPQNTDTSAAIMTAAFAYFALPDGGAVGADLLEHVKKGHPDDALFLLAWAKSDLLRGATDRAIELAREVAAMPDRPLSIDGVLLFNYRAEAVKLQVDAVYSTWERSRDAAEREQLVKTMKALRDDLSGRVGDTAAPVLSTDARLALISGDTSGARTLISRYNDQTQQTDAQMLVLEGELLRRTGNKGAAKQRFERAFSLEKANPRVAIALAEMELAENNYKDAARYYAVALQLLPDNEALKDQLKKISALAQGNLSDPILKCLKEAQDLTFGVGSDLAAAAAVLRDCLRSNPADVRVTAGLARILAAQQKRDEALQVVNDSLIKHPQDPTLLQLKSSLDVQDPYAYSMGVIEKTPNLSEAQKELLRADICRRVTPPRPDEATQHLENAARLAPEDPDVVEMLFVTAASKEDMVEVERLAALAERLNLDKVGGLLYKGRKELYQSIVLAKENKPERAQQKMTDAAATMRLTVEKDKLCQPAWRTLGLIYTELGRTQEAVDALAKAVEIRPDDVLSVNAYIRALVAAGRGADALAFARKSELVASADPTFVEMLLTLEQQMQGGSVDRAIALRQRMVEKINPKTPAAVNNKQQLASLLINAERLVEAKKVIDELMVNDADDPVTNELVAGWMGKSGDIKGAVKHYADFIEKLPEEKRAPLIYINAARLLLQLGQPDAALAMLDRGRKFQDAKSMVVDREIGDVLFNLNRMEAAAQAYMRVIDSGAEDTDLALHKRVLECLLNQDKPAEFDAFLAKIPQNKQDSTILLLSAEAASRANDREKARRLYDQVVALNPKNEIGYIKRADFNWNDPKMSKDVDADLEQVLRINPNSVVARVKRALRFRQNGKDDLAIQELKLAVANDPFNDQLRLALIQTYNELGRLNEAATACDEAVQQTEGSLQWRARTAEAYARIGKFDKAAEHWSAVWRERKTAEVAGFYADALIRNGTPADVNAAVNVLSAPEIAKDTGLGMRMMRARLMAKRGLTLDAATEVAAILAALDQNSRDQVGGFVANLTAMYPKTADQIGALARLESRAKFQGYMALQAATIRLRTPETKPQAVAALQDLAENSQDSRLKGAAYASLGTLAYQDRNWEEARQLFQKGLDADADNPELNNNMAYVLSVKLGRGAEGLPFAQKSIAAASSNSGFRDTLGAVYLAMNEPKKAVVELNQAISQALNDAERAPAYIHLGMANFALGDKIEARRNATQARELLVSNEGLRTAFEEDLKELERKLDGLK